MANEKEEVRRQELSIQVAREILEEVSRQDITHEAGYPATRDGVRVGLADAQDELNEALQSMLLYKLTRNWGPMREELKQCAAVIISVMREIDSIG
jgi:hypothetical protein